MISEREKLEFDSVPEFVREPRANTRDSYASKVASSNSNSTFSNSNSIFSNSNSTFSSSNFSTSNFPEEEAEVLQPVRLSSALLPKSAELETLWPGVGHETLHIMPKKGPSFYLCVGFMAGAVCSMVAIFGYSAISHLLTTSPSNDKQIVVSQGSQFGQSGVIESRNGTPSTLSTTSGEPEVIVPLNASYEVGSGDTLAAIALKNYKRATPRLLDEICRSNNLRNANVLSLGQKLTLPEYRPQSRQIAVGANTIQ